MRIPPAVTFSPYSPMRIALVAAVAVVASSLTVLTGAVSPASADASVTVRATPDPDDPARLLDNGATDLALALKSSQTVTLGSDIDDYVMSGYADPLGRPWAETPLAVGSGANVTLDLHGHTLVVRDVQDHDPGIAVPAGSSLTIEDSVGGGSLRVVGGYGAAGIGGYDGYGVPDLVGSITILSGDVQASGGVLGAGIGGGDSSPGGTVAIEGGVVTAVGLSAAGIGGGYQGDGGAVTLAGGVVTAYDDIGFGAGIGAGASTCVTESEDLSTTACTGGTLSISATTMTGATTPADGGTATGPGAAVTDISGADSSDTTLRYRAASTAGRFTATVGHTLTFDPDGDGATIPAAELVGVGSTTWAPAKPLLQGEAFQGWETTAAGGTDFAFGGVLSANTTVYGSWANATSCASDAAELSDDLAAVTSGSGTVTLCGDITANVFAGGSDPAVVENAGTDVTLDLNGFQLSVTSTTDDVAGIYVPTTSSLTIEDPTGEGSLYAQGGSGAAGIGEDVNDIDNGDAPGSVSVAANLDGFALEGDDFDATITGDPDAGVSVLGEEQTNLVSLVFGHVLRFDANGGTFGAVGGEVDAQGGSSTGLELVQPQGLQPPGLDDVATVDATVDPSTLVQPNGDYTHSPVSADPLPSRGDDVDDTNGYTFAGWSTEPDADVPFVFGADLAQDTTVYAMWRPNPTEPDPVRLTVNATAGDGEATVTWNEADTGHVPMTSWTLETFAAGTLSGSVQLDGSVSSSTVTGLTDGTAYTFAVCGSNDPAITDCSTTTSGRTTAYTHSGAVTPSATATAPGAPTAVSVTRSYDPDNGDQMTLGWTPPADGGDTAITGYSVRASSDGGVTWTAATTSNSTATSATVTGLGGNALLVNGTAYMFEVAASNGAGLGAWSAPSSPVTASAAVATVPDAPPVPSAVAGDGQVTLSWGAPDGDGGSSITGYDIQYSTDDGSSWTPVTTAVTSSPYVITGLTDGTAYVFQVADVNGVGPGTWSATSASATPVAPPGAPAIESATPGDGQVALTWSPTGTGGSAITGYQVRYSSAYTSDDATTGASWTTPVDAGTATSKTITGLSDGTAYTFEVGATNALGTTWSAPAVATPATLPGTPTLAAQPGLDSVGLSWSVATTGGSPITDYQVQYRAGDSGDWSSSVDVGAVASTTFSTTSTPAIADDTVYEFQARAENSAGWGPWSSAVTAENLQSPSQPAITSVSAGDATASLAWTRSTDNGTDAVTYSVYLSSDGGGTWTPAGTGLTALGTTVTGLSDGTSYVFTVIAVNEAGQTSSAVSAAVTPQRTSAPGGGDQTGSTGNQTPPPGVGTVTGGQPTQPIAAATGSIESTIVNPVAGVTTTAATSAAPLTVTNGDATAAATGGTGTLQIGSFGANPVAVAEGTPGVPASGVFVPKDGTGEYFDVRASADSTFTQVTVALPADADSLQFWNGTAWMPVQAPVITRPDGSLAVVLSGTTVPTVSQLTGTVFAASTSLPHFVTPTASWSGRAKVGKTLTLTVKGLPPGAKVTYAWYAAGEKLARKTRKALKITKADRGKTLKAVATVAEAGYASVRLTMTSRRVR